MQPYSKLDQQDQSVRQKAPRAEGMFGKLDEVGAMPKRRAVASAVSLGSDFQVGAADRLRGH